jgi:hypothetical protein
MKISMLCALALLACAAPATASAQAITAFKARDLAKRHVDANYQYSLIAAEGRRSEVSRQPVTWMFWYYDPTAAKEGRRITVNGTAVTDARDGYTQLERGRVVSFQPDEVIPAAKLKIDSDEALGRIMSQGALKPYRATSSAFRLTLDPELKAPVWEVRVWGVVDGETVLLASALLRADTAQFLELNARPVNAEPPSRWQKFQDLFRKH